MTDTFDRREQRIAKLDWLREQGVDPYPARVHYTHRIQEALEAFEAAPEDTKVTVAVVGRLMSIRAMGKSTFAHIADGTGTIQIYLRRDVVGEEAYERFSKGVDLGDFVGVSGSLFRTRSGEITVEAVDWQMLSKTLRPLPEKWHGLRDVEARYRQRYLDLLSNEESRRIFITRTRLVSALRRWLDARDFLEVETPVLQRSTTRRAARRLPPPQRPGSDPLPAHRPTNSTSSG
jgi:lysyl-tRNA synthetase class 2